MSVKTAGVGHFQIPTAPAAGTSVTSGAANVYTTNAVQLIASTAAALYITGIYAEEAAASAPTYKSVQLMIGAGGAETNLGQYLIGPSTGSTVARTYRPIFPPIPVAISQRISVKTADSVGSLATLISLECIAQSNVVDDGIAVTSVTTVGTLTTYTGNTPQTGDAFLIVKAGGTGDNAAIKTKTDFLPSATAGAAGGVQIAGTNAATTYATLTSTGAFTVSGVANVSQTGDSFAVVKATGTGDNAAIKAKTDLIPAAPASTTNITGGTITTVTNLTNAPTAGDFTATMKTSLNAATPASVTGAVGSVTGAVGSVTGAVGSVTGNVGGNVTGSVGSVTGLTASNLDATVSSRLASASYAAPLTAATTRTALGLVSANLDTQLAALATSAQATAIQAKTDSLTFAVAGKLDVNVLAVNGLIVTGSGTAGVPWGPA